MDIRLREATHFPGPRSCGCGDFVRGHALAIVGRRTQSPQQRGQASTPHKTGPFWWVFLGTLSEFMLGLRTPRSPRTPPWRGARVSGTSTFQNHHLGREGPHTSLLAGAHQCCSTLFPITPLLVPPPTSYVASSILATLDRPAAGRSRRRGDRIECKFNNDEGTEVGR